MLSSVAYPIITLVNYIGNVTKTSIYLKYIFHTSNSVSSLSSNGLLFSLLINWATPVTKRHTKSI